MQYVDWPARTYARTSGAVRAIEAAQAETDRPSFIALRTDHRLAGARPSRTPARRTARRWATRRSPPTKKILGFDPDQSLRGRRRGARARPRGWSSAAGPHGRVAAGFDAWARGQPRAQGAVRPDLSREPAAGWTDALPTFPTERTASRSATRKASGKVLTALAAGAAGAVGRLGRPRRVEQHHDGGRADLRPGRPPDQGLARRPVRPHPALRHPRARAWARS